VLLSAQFKAGKTTLVGNYIRSLADGDPWLGQYDVVATSTTIAALDFEMSPDTHDAWLGAQRIRRDDKVLSILMRGNARAFDILDPGRRREWAQRLKVLGVEVLILDCLRPVLDALGLDEHKDVGQFLVAFDALLSEAEIEDALIVHHHGHNGERARGDSRLLDWPDVVWKLVRQDDQPASPRFISAYGRDVDVSESQLAYDPHTRRLTLLGGSRADVKTTAALDAVLDVLEAQSDLSGHKVWLALKESGHPKNAIEDALKAGRINGRLIATPGPRGAILYRSGSASRTFPALSQGRSEECVSDLPSSPLGEREGGTLRQVSASIQPASRREGQANDGRF
jgi:hypothetical protein